MRSLTALNGQSPAPNTIYVGNGYFNGEFYDFYSDREATNQIYINNYVFYKGSTYTFEKISGSGHPFYLSDVPNMSGNSYHLGTLSLQLESDNQISQFDGITSSESFTFTIPDNYTNQLHYYCTRILHTTMVNSLSVVDAPSLI